MGKHDALFEPIKIGNAEIKNRLVLAPTNTNYSCNHLASDQTLAFYAARARGGLGLLVFEATPVSPAAAETSIYNIHHFWGPEHVPGMLAVTRAVHSYGAKIFIQLSPGLGVQAALKDSGVIPRAPSAVPLLLQIQNLPETLVDWYLKNPQLLTTMEGETPAEMSEEEIEERIAAFSQACKRALQAGFDGVEIHSPHGYLVHDFLSPRFNRRTDTWGGNLENRMRFLLRLIVAAREVLQDNFALGARLSMDERNEDGIHLDEMVQVAGAAAEAGLDYLHVSDGCYEQAKYFLPDEDGSMLEGAVAFKQAAGIPVITPCLHDPDNATRAVEEGKTDLVSSSRAFIADPEWANKVQEGRGEEIRKCTRCNRCIFELFSSRPVRCSANKRAGMERFELTKLLKLKK